MEDKPNGRYRSPVPPAWALGPPGHPAPGASHLKRSLLRTWLLGVLLVTVFSLATLWLVLKEPSWEAKAEDLARAKIKGADSFFAFAGLGYGDSLENVLRIYGGPGTVIANENYEYHRYGDVTIGVQPHSGRVAVVRVERNWSALGNDVRHRIGDPRFAFLGEPERHIRQVLGPPTKSAGGTLHYRLGSPDGAHGEVQFDCYPFDGARCGMMLVYWFYAEK